MNVVEYCDLFKTGYKRMVLVNKCLALSLANCFAAKLWVSIITLDLLSTEAEKKKFEVIAAILKKKKSDRTIEYKI